MKMEPLSSETPVGSLVPYYIQNVDKSKETKDNVWEPFYFNMRSHWGAYSTIAANAVGDGYDAFGLNTALKDGFTIPQAYDPTH
jgi:hypothetical protein